MYFANGEVPAMESKKPDNCAETRLALPPNAMDANAREGQERTRLFYRDLLLQL
jgi:hypothetical protein